MLALKDSMQAAQMSKVNDELRAQIATLKAQNATLTRKLREQDTQLTRCRKDLKWYRKRHMEAYAKILCNDTVKREPFGIRALKAFAWITCGAVCFGTVTWVIIALAV